MSEGAWQFLADLDPAAFRRGDGRAVHYKQIALRAGIAPTCLYKLKNNKQSLTLHIADALVELAGQFGIDEDAARVELFARPTHEEMAGV
ncbi:MAG TPA: hypothetical protein VLT58_12250 [Polyangia bacterium]|nr:hypothetical protein [Polyangia bacterium]